MISRAPCLAVLAGSAIVAGICIYWIAPQPTLQAPQKELVEATERELIGNASTRASDDCFQIGKRGRMPFITVNVGGREIRMLVDTGCSQTGLDSSFESSLGESVGRTVQKSFAGLRQTDLFTAPQFEIGKYEFQPDQPVYCQDFSEMRTFFGEKFYGILGMDILRSFVLQFDFDQGELRLSKAPASLAVGKGAKFKLGYEPSGCPTILARCGSIDQRFILDTGSTSTCVDESLYEKLIHEGDLDPGPTHRATSLGGMTNSRSGLLQTLKVGSFVHDDLLCDKDSMCVIGLRYLCRYRVTFDFPNATLYLDQGEAFAKPDPRGVSGLWPIRNENGFIVHQVTPGGAADRAGIQAGDEIREVNGEAAAKMDMFRMGRLLTTSPGQKLELNVVRDEQQMRKVIVVADRFPSVP